MKSYLAILRGINVSGQKKIIMEDLRTLMSSLEFKNVETYIQSGNVIFDAPKSDNQKIAQIIQGAIFKQYNFEVPVLVKTREEMEIIAANNPFVNDRNENIKFIAVTFLEEKRVTSDLENIEKEIYLPDEFLLSGNAIYLFCPNGFGRTKLTNTFFERKLKVTATTRNWKSVIKLTAMLMARKD